MKYFYSILLLLATFTLNAQIVTIPDANFKAKLILQNSTATGAQDINDNYIIVDTNNDGEIQLQEAQLVYTLDISVLSISSMIGIQSFTNLHTLYCNYNTFTALDLSGMSNLNTLYCEHTPVTTLNLTGLNNISILELNYNSLTSLDLTGLNNLTWLNCNYGQLTSLLIYGNSSLHDIACDSNLLTSISLTNLPNLAYADFSNNQITSFNYSNLPTLYSLGLGNNALTQLDLSGLPSLVGVYCSSNPLTAMRVNGLTNLQTFTCGNCNFVALDLSPLLNLEELNLNDNSQLTVLSIKGLGDLSMTIQNNFNLQYICTSPNEIALVQDVVTFYGITNCQVNSDCLSNPQGITYSVQGSLKLDSNNNGCDSNDLIFPNLKVLLTNETDSVNIISDTSGDYLISILPGSYTITAAIQNQSYFNVTPTSIQVNFPAQTSPLTQNFCITLNGQHQDIESWIIPVTPARPGFDPRYKIKFKNNGSVAVSGYLDFSFDDDYMDFIEATPNPNSQNFSLLSWNYVNLLPFETREIEVKFNLNNAQEVFPLAIGDLIKFQSTVYPLSGDENISDNSNYLSQILVGSFVPNDKICAEGPTIAQDMVGEYLHYIIRFENTGTFAAENIVVKDMIDETKFDINSLVPLSGSHNFFTKITANKVEFVFENINLPFDDATNDGYVAFKVKTKPTLQLGDTFSNTASIYFDYNFPIVTNTATTLIQILGTQDFEFGTYFTVYPNPASTVLNLETKAEIGVESITIYTFLGQIVIAIPNAENVTSIDVADLRSGTYFIKLYTDKGIADAKFIKE